MGQHETEKFEAQRTTDAAFEFDRIRIDAAAEPRFWSIPAIDAASYFEQAADLLFRDISRNYYDEAEIGRLAKEAFRNAIHDSVNED